VVFTDHETLTRLKTQKEVHKKLSRWLGEIESYSITISHKPGKSNIVADALSRRPDLPEETVTATPILMSMVDLDTIMPRLQLKKDLYGLYTRDFSDWPIIEIFRRWQNKFPDSTSDESRKYIDKKSKQIFNLGGGAIGYRNKNGMMARFVPLVYRLDVISRFHAAIGHAALYKTYDLMRKSVWWPHMKDTLKLVIRTCIQCQIHANSNLKSKKEPLHPLQPASPFQRWGIDFIGELPLTPRGNRWILVAIDHATGWPILRALSDATHSNVAQFLYENIFKNFGPPAEIISDQGPQFTAKAFQEFIQTMKVKHNFTTAYHPRSNGKTEKLNDSIVKAISKWLESSREDWDLYVDRVEWILRIRKHEVMAASPYFMVFGVDPPVQDTIPMIENKPINPKFRKMELENLELARKDVAARQKKAAQIAEKNYNKNVKPQPLPDDSWVLVRLEKRLKFQPRWFGPFKIARSTDKGTYQLVDPHGKFRTGWVNRDRLLPVRGTPGSTNQWWYIPALGQSVAKEGDVVTSLQDSDIRQSSSMESTSLTSDPTLVDVK
jgi:transposase InsO family protein